MVKKETAGDLAPNKFRPVNGNSEGNIGSNGVLNGNDNSLDKSCEEEYEKLRCSTVRTEVLSARQKRRAGAGGSGYPGLAFGSSIFNSNSMMKFSLIANELHNIMNVQLKRAEGEVAALNRRIQLIEDDLERSETRLASATEKLSEASQAADESERFRKLLENKTHLEDDKIEQLESQLFQARTIAEESDKKYDEMTRKIELLEKDVDKAERRADTAERKIVELEEELRVVGNNLKSLEVSEEKAIQREEGYEMTIRSLTSKLKEAEARAEFGERSVQKLQKEVDRLEDHVHSEKQKNALFREEVESTIIDIQAM